MQKRLIALALLATFAVAARPAPALAASPASIKVNHQPVSSPEPPLFYNNRLLVPVRVIAENLGATVHWHPASRQVVIWNERGQRIELTIGQNRALVNGEALTIDAPALLRQNRTYLPLRFVGEMLGAQVDWHAGRREASLTTVEPSHLAAVHLSDVLDLQFSGTARPVASGFLMQSPDRVIVDLPHTVLPADHPRQLAGRGPVQGVRLLPKPNGSLRVVLDVDRPLYPRLEATATGYRVHLIEEALRGRKIYLDPGHGGKEPGAIANGVVEKVPNLAIALRLKALLEEQGAEVMISREGDQHVSLESRAQAANRWGAEVFVSIHNNSNGVASIHGSQTYYHFRDGGSSTLAQLLHQALLDATGQANRGIRQADFAVTRLTRMPAVLVEVAFITNPSDAQRMMDPAFQERVATGLRVGLNNYFLGR